MGVGQSFRRQNKLLIGDLGLNARDTGKGAGLQGLRAVWHFCYKANPPATITLVKEVFAAMGYKNKKPCQRDLAGYPHEISEKTTSGKGNG